MGIVDLSQQEAETYGVTTLHQLMDHREIRFRLVKRGGSSYIRTEAIGSGWQRSHSHLDAYEIYLIEKGPVSLAVVNQTDQSGQLVQCQAGQSFTIMPGTAHSLFLAEGAVLHTVKLPRYPQVVSKDDRSTFDSNRLDALLAIDNPLRLF